MDCDKFTRRQAETHSILPRGSAYIPTRLHSFRTHATVIFRHQLRCHKTSVMYGRNKNPFRNGKCIQKRSFIYLRLRSEKQGGVKELSSRRKLILTQSSLPFVGSSKPQFTTHVVGRTLAHFQRMQKRHKEKKKKPSQSQPQNTAPLEVTLKSQAYQHYGRKLLFKRFRLKRQKR